MTFAELTQTHGWKSFMAKLYGLGAAVVIVGAMFKIMHWPGAGAMLVVGLSVEAVIFGFSAFEPIHEDLDWTLVYPELAGMSDDDEMETYKENTVNSRGEIGLEKFENLVKIPTSSITSDTYQKFNEGLEKLNATASGIGDIADVAVATKAYAANFKNASQSLESFSTSYSQNAETLKSSVSVLANSYQKTAEVVTKMGSDIYDQVQKSGASFTDTYSKLSQSITSYSNSITEGGKSYGGNLEKLNKSLGEMNTLYEMQIKGSNEYLKTSDRVYKDMDNLLSNLTSSVEDTKKYKNEMAKLSENLANLNSIYGNMLSAMSTKK